MELSKPTYTHTGASKQQHIHILSCFSPASKCQIVRSFVNRIQSFQHDIGSSIILSSPIQTSFFILLRSQIIHLLSHTHKDIQFHFAHAASNCSARMLSPHWSTPSHLTLTQLSSGANSTSSHPSQVELVTSFSVFT